MKTQEDKLKLLEETKLYYSEDPLRRCTGHFGCFYSGSSNKKTTSLGCAIGRLIPTELAEEIDTEFKHNEQFSGVIHIFDRLPTELQEYGKSYLVQLQMFHDSDSYWNDKGITSRGESFYLQFISKIKNNLI